MPRIKREPSSTPSTRIKSESDGRDEQVTEVDRPWQKRPSKPHPQKRRRVDELHGEADEAPPCKRRAKAIIANEAPTTRLRVFVFGTGECGELGLGPFPYHGGDPALAKRPRINRLLNPVSVGIVQLAVGGMHCAALTHDGRVLTWGVNDSKALGRDTTSPTPCPDATDADLHLLESTPMEVSGLAGLDLVVTQVVATDNAMFVLAATGLVYGWETFCDNDGPLGFLKKTHGGNRPRGEQRFQPTPVQVPGVRDVKELAAGLNHVLALTHNDIVYAWGCGEQAELGRRPGLRQRHRAESLVPRAVALPKRAVVCIFAGFNHSFAIDTKGSVWTWGLNNFGQTGIPYDADNLHVAPPRIVDSLEGRNIAHMAGGFHHSLACTGDGHVLGWGRCDDAQLGIDVDSLPANDIQVDNRNVRRILSVPTIIPDVDATQVAAGIDNSLSINAKGRVLAWGFSDGYRTGLGTEKSVPRPTLLSGKGLGDLKFTFVDCGGQFSVIAGPAPRETVDLTNN